jgi:hypothetical protein
VGLAGKGNLMSSTTIRGGIAALALGLPVLTGAVAPSPAHAAAGDYRFEMVGKPQLANGKDIVRVRLLHIADGKTVSDAVIFETKADMEPAGMPTMTAPAKLLKSSEPGIYQVEVDPGMTGSWAIRLAAKVQGETETVRGTLNTELAK